MTTTAEGQGAISVGDDAVPLGHYFELNHDIHEILSPICCHMILTDFFTS